MKTTENLVERFLERRITRTVFMREAVLLGLSMSAASSLLEACASGGTNGTKSSTLVIGVPATPTTLDPEGIGSLAQDLEVATSTYDKFLMFPTKTVNGINQADVAARPLPLLAESWSVSPDSRNYTFNLRKGVKSQYGNEMTADDVIWSWDRVFGVKGVGLFGLGVSSVTKGSYTAVDKYTVHVDVGHTNALFPTVIATPVPGYEIYDSTEVKKHSTADDPWARTWLATNNAGFGPYYAQSFAPGQQIVYVPNPNYYRAKPAISKVIYKAVADPASRFALLKSGDIDIAEELTTVQRRALAGVNNVKVIDVPGNLFIAFGLLNTHPPLDDVRVRQAIAYAMPIPQIIETVFFNQPGVRLFKGFVADVVPGYPDRWPYQPQDLQKAKALLAQAGKKNISFELSYTSSFAEHEAMAQLIKTAMEQVGINVVLNKLTPSAYQEQYFTHKAQSVLVQDAAFVLDPAYPLFLYFGQGPSANGNWINYKDKGAQDLIDQALGTPDFNGRLQLSQQADNMIIDDAPWGMNLGIGYHLAVASSVQGLVWRPNNVLQFYDFSKS